MKLYILKVEDLIEHPDYNKYFNFKKEKYYFNLMRHIGNFGIWNPIIVNEITSYILDGHKRYYICKDIGIKEIPSIVISERNLEKEIHKLITFNTFRQTDYNNTINAFKAYSDIYENIAQ